MDTYTKTKRPMYEALDNGGHPYQRRAKVIGELPTPAERLEALPAATTNISTLLNIPAIKSIAFGMPVYEAFGLNKAEAKRHTSYSGLLLTTVSDLSLDYCGL